MTDRPTHHYTAYDKAYEKTERYKVGHRMRLRARYAEVKKLGKEALKGIDIDHKHSIATGGDNDPSNWRLRSVHSNRGDKSFVHEAGYHPFHLRRH